MLIQTYFSIILQNFQTLIYIIELQVVSAFALPQLHILPTDYSIKMGINCLCYDAIQQQT